MTKLLLALTLTAMSLAAADATGKWIGTLNPQGEEEGQSRPAYMVLKQEGTKLTGTAGPDASEQHQIEDGKVEVSEPRPLGSGASQGKPQNLLNVRRLGIHVSLAIS